MLCSTDENPLKIRNIEKYQIIDALKNEFTIEQLSKVLNITSRSYRKWVQFGRRPIHSFNTIIADIIEVEHYNTKEVYGVFRLKKHIEQIYGLVLNHKLIRRYRIFLGLTVKVRKRKHIYKSKKEKNINFKKLMAPNLLENNFTSRVPYQKLSTDVSYINCTNGRLYLSAVKDLFNNKIIAYNVSHKNDTKLIIDTFKKIPSGDGIIHSDQGSVYYSIEYREFITNKGYTRSMSRRGACWENSPIENWFSQLKEEQLRRIGKTTKSKTRLLIKEYVDWYNNQRIQKDLGYKCPAQYLNI